jgi:inosose dehydratase
MPIRVANAPCSWGVLEFDEHASALRCGDVLDQLASCGYAASELGDWGFMPTDPRGLRQEIEKRSLALVGAFVPVPLSEPAAADRGIETAVRTARLLNDAGFGSAFIVLADATDGNARRIAIAGRVTEADGLGAPEWDRAARTATGVASAVRAETGLRTVFHPHCGSFVETEAEIESLMGRTDPGLLGLCLDTGHLAYAGADPLQVYDRYHQRVWHVHLKDCDPDIAATARREEIDYFQAVRRGVFCELGRGAVDFAGLLRLMRGANYDGWVVVEQDVLPALGTPEASARRNRQYLRGLGL